MIPKHERVLDEEMRRFQAVARHALKCDNGQGKLREVNISVKIAH